VHFLIELGTIFWIFNTTKIIISYFLFVFFYPFIVIFWKVPAVLVKRGAWLLIIAMVIGLQSIYGSFKYSFIFTTIFLVSCVISIQSQNIVLLYITCISLASIVTISYIYEFISVFKKIDVVSEIEEIGKKATAYIKTNNSIDNDIKKVALANMTEEQREKWKENLQYAVFTNRLYLFLAKRLSEYQERGLNAVSSMASIGWLIFVTIMSFACIHYGLFKIDGNYYSIDTQPIFFDFIYLSYKSFLFDAGGIIAPQAVIAKLLEMLESFFTLSLLVILTSLFFSLKSRKDYDATMKVIRILERESKEIETFILDEFSVNNLDTAMKQLSKLKASFADILFKMSKSL